MPLLDEWQTVGDGIEGVENRVKKMIGSIYIGR